MAYVSQAAAQPQRAYQITPGALEVAVTQFVQQADQEIIFDQKLLASRRSPGFSGRATAAEALTAILAGTGVTFSRSRTGVFLLAKLSESRRTPLAPKATAAQVRPKGPSRSPEGEVLALDEIIVTGSLVVRDGYDAPTPVTTALVAELARAAPSNISSGLNQLPQFAGSRNESQGTLGTVTYPQAGNYLNLRNLGFSRSLVLLDGRRLAPTSYEGTVDANIVPQALIKRVDVVTAGASATYGSDALTGVVNFIIDKDFTGLKGQGQGGVSQRGDNNVWSVGLGYGAPVMGGRGHLLLSAEHFQSDGVKDRSRNALYDRVPVAFGNGSTIPYRIEYDGRFARTTHGGLILTGPLAMRKFEKDGSLSPFDPGRASLGGVQLGGDGGRSTGGALTSGLRTDQLFARLDGDLASNVTGYVQAAFGESRNRYVHNGNDNRLGNLTIYADNAFLRPEIAAAIGPGGSFMMGRQGFEQGGKYVDVLSSALAVFAGLEGEAGEGWGWRATYTYGSSVLRSAHQRNPENRNYFAALDAVRAPSGDIVCRVTVTNPGLYPGCAPLNLFGIGNASREALEYAFGADSQYRASNRLQALSLNLTGTPVRLPAGDLSVAVGAEHRWQSLVATSNADPATPIDTTGIRGFPSGMGRFGNTNVGVADGEAAVSEVFAEVAAPLAADLPLAKSVDLTAALRWARYTTVGQAWTYKLGMAYAPLHDLRLRGAISRDIRAPALYELFAGPSLNTQPFADVHTGVPTSITTITNGNPNLKRELGFTRTLGLVYQPGWLDGLNLSVDYYRLTINDGIVTSSAAQQNLECETSGGAAEVCAFIIRPLPFSNRSEANVVQRVQVVAANIARIATDGVDVEAAYRFGLGDYWGPADGYLRFHLLANYIFSRTYRAAGGALREDAGIGGGGGVPFGGPKLRAVLSADYQGGAWTLYLQERLIGPMQRSNNPAVIFAENKIEAVTYTDLTLSRKFVAAGRRLEGFLTVANLTDRDAPMVPQTNEPGTSYPTLQILYDVVGRQFTAGVRFEF